MKKITLFLILFTFVFTSCKKDDDATNVDSFVGTLTIQKVFINDIEQTIGDCGKKFNIIVNANGTLTSNIYEEGNPPDSCISSIEKGTWKNKGDSKYSTTIDGKTNELTVTFESNTVTIITIENSKTVKQTFTKS